MVGFAQRLVFAFGDRAGRLLVDAPGEATFQVTTNGEPVGNRVAVAPRTSGVPRPYYPLVVTPEHAGLHEVTATVAGDQASAAFVVGAIPPPLVPGRPMAPVPTPTTSHHRGVRPICTRTPPCPFHDVSLDEALRRHDRVALLVASPGHCDSSLCPPAVDLLMKAAPRYQGVTFVHAEVYTDADGVDSLADANPTEVVRAYELDFEPSLLLAKADGTLSERLDHIFDVTELDEALLRLTHA